MSKANRVLSIYSGSRAMFALIIKTNTQTVFFSQSPLPLDVTGSGHRHTAEIFGYLLERVTCTRPTKGSKKIHPVYQFPNIYLTTSAPRTVLGC